jgi:hypothetical protein
MGLMAAAWVALVWTQLLEPHLAHNAGAFEQWHGPLPSGPSSMGSPSRRRDMARFRSCPNLSAVRRAGSVRDRCAMTGEHPTKRRAAGADEASHQPELPPP